MKTTRILALVLVALLIGLAVSYAQPDNSHASDNAAGISSGDSGSRGGDGGSQNGQSGATDNRSSDEGSRGAFGRSLGQGNASGPDDKASGNLTYNRTESEDSEYGLNYSSNQTNVSGDDSESDSGRASNRSRGIGFVVSDIARTTRGEHAGDMSQVVAFIKDALRNPNLSATQTPQEFREEVQAEALALIASNLTNASNVSLGNASGLVNNITVGSDNVSLDNTTVSTGGSNITAETDEGNVTLSQTEDGVNVTDEGNTTASAGSLSIVNGALMFNGERIVLPSFVRSRVHGDIQALNLTVLNGNSVYLANVTTHARLLGLFAVNYSSQSTMDAQNGNNLGEQAPWWAFLTTRD